MGNVDTPRDLHSQKPCLKYYSNSVLYQRSDLPKVQFTLNNGVRALIPLFY